MSTTSDLKRVRVSNPQKVRISGPLVPFVAGLVAEFESLGYARSSAAIQMGVVAHLSRWLATRGLSLNELSDEVIGQFLIVRRERYSSHYSLPALAPALGYLRRVGAVPAASQVAPSGPVDEALSRFCGYLLRQRCLSAEVGKAYARYVKPFVAGLLGSAGQVDFNRVSAAQVTGFLAEYLPGRSNKQAQMTACALRSFLRFAYAEGLVGADFSPAVPAVASWRLSGVPKALPAEQVQMLLGACDTATALGRRDYAVIACLSRLGMRAGEVGALLCADVDWLAGVLTVRGKGGRVDQLPIPVDVGQALVAYLRFGRPTTSAGTVFVCASAPFSSLGYSGVSCIVARAAARAGLGTVHAHRLRHSAATATLNAGASLEEVSLLLRHASPATTMIYAKTDLSRLTGIARPWPTSGDRS